MRHRLLWLGVLVILAYFAVRLHHLLALPLFIDETLHVERAASTLRGSALWFGANGKLLGSWWLAAFIPANPSPWLIRVATLLLPLLGVAASLALAQRVFTMSAAFYCGVLLIFTPMLFFFDRLALADTTLHPMATLFILSLFLSFDAVAGQRRRFVLAGGLLALAVMAKATALAIVPMPLIAAIILPQRWRLRDCITGTIWVYATAIVLWIPLLFFMSQRGINYLGVPVSEHSTAADSLLLINRIAANTAFFIDALVVYFGVVPLLMAMAALVIVLIRRTRAGMVLLLAVGGLAASVILLGNQSISVRYWLALIPVALVLVAGGLDILTRRLRYHQWLVPAILAFWMALSALPFISTASNQPEVLRLPEKDRLEYLEADSAGTAIPQLATYLAELQAENGAPLYVTGAISQCVGLTLYLPADSDIVLDCPRVSSAEYRGDWLDQHVTELAQTQPDYVVVFEQPGLVTVDTLESIALNPLMPFARPGNLVTITVYEPVVEGN